MLLLAVQTGLRAAWSRPAFVARISYAGPAPLICPMSGQEGPQGARHAASQVYHRVVLRDWLNERKGQPSDVVFPTLAGHKQH